MLRDLEQPGNAVLSIRGLRGRIGQMALLDCHREFGARSILRRSWCACSLQKVQDLVHCLAAARITEVTEGGEAMDLKGLFDSFYEKLVLRDFLGKVTPGLLFLSGLVFGLFGPETLRSCLDAMTGTTAIAVVGLAWIAGCALQAMGEVRDDHGWFLKTHPKAAKDREEFYLTWARFHRTATPRELVQAERLNVLKEACGNTAVALVVVTVLSWLRWLDRHVLHWTPTPWVLVTLMGLVAAFCLFRMHTVHVARYGAFLAKTIAPPAQNAELSPAPDNAPQPRLTAGEAPASLQASDGQRQQVVQADPAGVSAEP